ncbi:MAG: isopentenyl-diphosphate Delta-isomerase [Candidatus Parcubacteria bacterium]|jgi:isopentenyl-diphosphate delta-isomerase|nr:isopentenyl-diphosphate Delta-isomerase [Candidatus Parcubacteria bacterium]
MDDVILVDEHDTQIGTMEKLAAHAQGRLHRAFSVFIFHSDGRMLLQRRAAGKYHSGGLWSNACCSHPRPGEPVEAAAHRRLREEMGIDCDLRETHAFIYRAPFPNGLIEHEYDHVFVGRSDDLPAPNPEEVDDWVWMDIPELRRDMKEHPEDYTYWFKVAFDRVTQKA